MRVTAAKRRWPVGAAAAGVALLAAACFLPALRNGFVYDDAQYIGANAQVKAGLSAAGLRWAGTAFYAANWHPLTWLSHMADVSLFGLSPAGHHLTSVLLHALNALLLFLVLERGTGRPGRSLLVSALFAVHPLRVESVAWVAERKDVLCAFFSLATLAAYLGYLRRPGRGRYFRVLLLTALALISKPMAVTLPFVLLLLDWWPLGRLGASGARRARGDPWRPWLEKAPLLLLAAASVVVTLAAQGSGDAVKSLERYPFPVRLGNALWSYAAYLGRTLWPLGLAAVYPHLRGNLPWSLPAGGAAILAAITAWALTRRRRPYLSIGWFWYLGTLVPVIGLVQVGGQAMADRYTYLPTIGLLVAAVWYLAERTAGKLPLAARVAAALLLTLAAGALTQRSIPFWKDDLSLWRRALAVTTDNFIAEANLGAALARQGQLADAAAHYRAALRLEPGHAETWNNLGLALSKSGALAEAEESFQRSRALNPGNAEVWNNLGVVYGKQQRWEAAAAAYEQVIALQPDSGRAYYNLGLARLSLGDRPRALRVLEILGRVDRDWAQRLAPFVTPPGDGRAPRPFPGSAP